MTTSWMISVDSAQLLKSYVGHGLTQTELSCFLGTGQPYELTRSVDNRVKTAFPYAALSLVFSDYNQLAATLDRPIQAGVKAVMYDPENWSFTPVAQQQNPALYEELAATAAHAHGLEVIAAPAANLTATGGAGDSAAKYQQYISSDYAGAAARYADVLDIQAQGLEANPAEYAHFLAQAIAQAKAANPDITIYAGLSTSGSGGSAITAADLYQDVMATQNEVSGYWLNVPGPSPYSPNVTASHPEVAVGLLNDLWAATRT